MSSVEPMVAKEGWIKSMKSLAITCQSLLCSHFLIQLILGFLVVWIATLAATCLSASRLLEACREYLAETVGPSS